jgi:uncharacterized protein (TIGR02453 family)
MMTFFSEDFMKFLKELAANNNKEWFDKNKTRFEKSVKKPFATFIDHLIGKLREINPEFTIEAKDAIFRIYRDVRFSTDKTPYKTHMSALISPLGRKDKTYPGIYIEFSPEHIRLYSGLYFLDTKQLKAVRDHLAGNTARYIKLRDDKQFRKTFGEILGEQHKRVPAEYQKAAEKIPEIVNKQFYFYTEFPSSMTVNKDLDKKMTDAYKTARPMMEFMAEPLRPE